MNKKIVYNLFYPAASVLLIAWFFVTIKQIHSWGGWFLMLFFLSLAIAFRGHKFLKGFSYTVLIFAAVSLSMCYPDYFKTVGNFNLTGIIVPLLQLIIFGMGTGIKFTGFYPHRSNAAVRSTMAATNGAGHSNHTHSFKQSFYFFIRQ